MFHDDLRFLRTLTIKKLWNAMLLHLSMAFSNLFNTEFVRGKPTTLNIEPTTHCNLSCPECPSGKGSLTRPGGFINLSLYQNIIDQTRSHITWLQLFFQGEPLLHPQIDEIIRYAKTSNLYTCISTNGHQLTRNKAVQLIHSGLDRIIISLDGADEATYNKYRQGGSFTRVINGIKTLVEEKQKRKNRYPYTILQFLVFRHNEHQIEDVKRLGEKLNVDKVEIKTAQIYDYKKKPYLIPLQQKYSRYIRNSKGEFILKKKQKAICPRLWLTSVITFDGKILPCCFDKNAEHKMDDMSNDTLLSAWKGIHYKTFRREVRKHRNIHSICRNCTE